MGMDLNVTGIDQEPLEISLTDQVLQKFFPKPLVSPSTKPPMGILPIPIIGRQIPPRTARAENPENRINKKSVVFGSASPDAFLSRQVGF
jgi:hypothetical protein